MPLTSLTIAPGIVTDETPTAAEGRYTAADKVRFRDGRPEVVGGWEAAITSKVTGVCRGLHVWSDNSGAPHVGIGTHSKLHVYVGGGLYDITPPALAAGNVDGTGGQGYGTGTWNTGTYGTASSVEYFPRTWSLDNWGEYLVGNPRGGGVYQWTGNTGTPAALVTNAPTQATCLFVTPQRHLVLCGTTEEGTGTFNPMLVRWSDQENNTVWTSSATNQAGEQPLAGGGRIVRGLVGRGENLIFTDDGLHSMRFDPSFVFTFQALGSKCGLIGPNAVAMKDGAAFWMSNSGQFYVYQGGAPQVLPCPVRRHVFDNLSFVQADKVYAGVNSVANEVWWFYPDRRDGNEVSRYVAYNYAEGLWSIGTWMRTAWADAGALPSPIAIDLDGSVYFHERGQSANGGAIAASLESGFVDIGDGDTLMHVKRIVPDFKGLVGGVDVSLVSRPWPQGSETTSGPYTIASTTQKVDCRVTGRQIAFRLESNSAPSFWRLGDMRVEMQATGARR
ncbi:hypothetical protein [Azospirillum soli]|uniref:hypothetical protein n=1 Tax=Azospirillum soli TaxID=1304799 RepID=UPI001AE76273|nr:hypothetical protein [Azospirillum soli]MBP2311881.1 hypothetical protein [Azospirillum soli]